MLEVDPWILQTKHHIIDPAACIFSNSKIGSSLLFAIVMFNTQAAKVQLLFKVAYKSLRSGIMGYRHEVPNSGPI